MILHIAAKRLSKFFTTVCRTLFAPIRVHIRINKPRKTSHYSSTVPPFFCSTNSKKGVTGVLPVIIINNDGQSLVTMTAF